MLQARTQTDTRVKNAVLLNLQLQYSYLNKNNIDWFNRTLTKLIQNSPTIMIIVQIDFYV